MMHDIRGGPATIRKMPGPSAASAYAVIWYKKYVHLTVADEITGIAKNRPASLTQENNPWNNT